MPGYHEQQDYPAPMMGGAGAGFVFLAALALATGGAGALFFGALWLVLLVTFWSFSRLVTTVTDQAVDVRFRFGWPRRRVVLSSVIAVESVRNSWWLGWGVRKVPKGWMYNVWGLDAVVLTLDSGAVLRIGTAHPRHLEAAIAHARSSGS